jgi:hypothetical protein
LRIFNQLEIEMSDQDNLLEDEYERKLEASNEARDAAIEFHRDNWLTAVTQSVEKSNGSFPDVSEYVGKGFDFKRVYRPAASVDVLVEELQNGDFMQRAAAILISIQANNANPQAEVSKLFQDMGDSYAEFQYDKNFKE